VQKKPEYVKKIIRLWIKQAKKNVGDRFQDKLKLMATRDFRKKPTGKIVVKQQKAKDSFEDSAEQESEESQRRSQSRS
jgi:hypothetical protein